MQRRSFFKLLGGTLACLAAPAVSLEAKAVAPDLSDYVLVDSFVRGYFEKGKFKRIYEWVNVVNAGVLISEFNPEYLTAPFTLRVYAIKPECVGDKIVCLLEPTPEAEEYLFYTDPNLTLRQIPQIDESRNYFQYCSTTLL